MQMGCEESWQQQRLCGGVLHSVCSPLFCHLTASSRFGVVLMYSSRERSLQSVCCYLRVVIEASTGSEVR